MGLFWAALPLFFFADADAGERFLIACVTAGMLCGGAFALASIPEAALSFVGPLACGSLVALLRSGDGINFLVALLLFIYTMVLLKAVWSHAELLKMRVLTEIARVSECAATSNAKSVFMANMSHG